MRRFFKCVPVMCSFTYRILLCVRCSLFNCKYRCTARWKSSVLFAVRASLAPLRLLILLTCGCHPFPKTKFFFTTGLTNLVAAGTPNDCTSLAKKTMEPNTRVLSVAPADYGHDLTPETHLHAYLRRLRAKPLRLAQRGGLLY